MNTTPKQAPRNPLLIIPVKNGFLVREEHSMHRSEAVSVQDSHVFETFQSAVTGMAEHFGVKVSVK